MALRTVNRATDQARPIEYGDFANMTPTALIRGWDCESCHAPIPGEALCLERTGTGENSGFVCVGCVERFIAAEFASRKQVTS